MRIVKVTSNSINRLVDSYKNSRDLSFGQKANSFYENVEICFYLTNLKGIEVLFLKSFCSSSIIFDSSNTSAFFKTPEPITGDVVLPIPPKAVMNEEDKKRKKDIEILRDSLLSYHNYLITNQGVRKEDPNYFGMFDIGSYRFDAIARFSGIDILSLFNAFPEFTLRKKNVKGEYYEEGTKEFENYCAKLFVQEFYSYINKTLAPRDILTDVRFEDEFLKLVNTSAKCVCTHIRNPIKELKMCNYNNSKELIYDANYIKSEASHYNYDINKDDDLIYHFAISGTMETLIKFLSFTNVVYYMTDLKTIVGTETKYELPFEIRDKVGVATIYNDAIKALDKYRLNILKEISIEESTKNQKQKMHYSKLEVYNLIPRSSNIKFMIKGTKNELTKVLNTLESKGYLLDNELYTIMSVIKSNLLLIDTVLK